VKDIHWVRPRRWTPGWNERLDVPARTRILFLTIALLAAALRGQTIDEFSIPTAASKPQCIATGPDGNLWFIENSANQIGRITPQGAITEFPVPGTGATEHLSLQCIAAGADGNLWFTASGPSSGRIGKISTGGAATLVSGTIPRVLYAITGGPDGNLWFPEYAGLERIGRLTPSGVLNEFDVAAVGFFIIASGITTGPDGAMWFAEGSASAIGRMTTDGTVTNQFPVLPTFTPTGITTGPDGALWFTLSCCSAEVGRMATDGTFAQYGSVTKPPQDIVTGSDGNLWVTETVDRIARVSPTTHQAKEFILATGSGPDGIASGPDGNIWFTEFTGNKIGRVNLGPAGSCGTGRAHVRPLPSMSTLPCVSHRS
jgi:virginiamycin B lyase